MPNTCLSMSRHGPDGLTGISISFELKLIVVHSLNFYKTNLSLAHFRHGTNRGTTIFPTQVLDVLIKVQHILDQTLAWCMRGVAQWWLHAVTSPLTLSMDNPFLL